MRYRPELLLVVLLIGFTLLLNHDHFPTWFYYVLMLAVLGGTYLLSPEWFQGTLYRLLWLAGIGVAVLGLVLELGSQLIR